MTDTGRVREGNEDTFILRQMWSERYALAAAIDGMGGYEGGEIAAEIAKGKIQEYLDSHPEGERGQLLKEAVVHANNAIVHARRSDVKLREMGCVLTALLLDRQGRKAWMAHIGDSRLYRFRSGVLTKLSHDMSMVGYREEMGSLTEEEAMRHPRRNVIDRAAGDRLLAAEDEDIETCQWDVQAGDLWLLNSDGLSDMVTSATISQILTKREPVEGSKEEASLCLADGEEVQACEAVAGMTRQLVHAANEAGGKDNITVVLIQTGERDAAEEVVEDAEEAPAPRDERVVVTECKET